MVQRNVRPICVRHGSAIAHVSSTEEAADLMSRLQHLQLMEKQKQQKQKKQQHGFRDAPLSCDGGDRYHCGASAAKYGIEKVVDSVRIAAATAVHRPCPTWAKAFQALRSINPPTQQFTKDIAALRKLGTADAELRHYDPVSLETLHERVLTSIQACSTVLDGGVHGTGCEADSHGRHMDSYQAHVEVEEPDR